MALLILIMTEGACIAKPKMGLAEWRRYKSDGRAQWKNWLVVLCYSLLSLGAFLEDFGARKIEMKLKAAINPCCGCQKEVQLYFSKARYLHDD